MAHIIAVEMLQN